MQTALCPLCPLPPPSVAFESEQDSFAVRGGGAESADQQGGTATKTSWVRLGSNRSVSLEPPRKWRHVISVGLVFCRLAQVRVRPSNDHIVALEPYHDADAILIAASHRDLHPQLRCVFVGAHLRRAAPMPPRGLWVIYTFFFYYSLECARARQLAGHTHSSWTISRKPPITDNTARPLAPPLVA